MLLYHNTILSYSRPSIMSLQSYYRLIRPKYFRNPVLGILFFGFFLELSVPYLQDFWNPKFHFPIVLPYRIPFFKMRWTLIFLSTSSDRKKSDISSNNLFFSKRRNLPSRALKLKIELKLQFPLACSISNGTLEKFNLAPILLFLAWDILGDSYK